MPREAGRDSWHAAGIRESDYGRGFVIYSTCVKGGRRPGVWEFALPVSATADSPFRCRTTGLLIFIGLIFCLLHEFIFRTNFALQNIPECGVRNPPRGKSFTRRHIDLFETCAPRIDPTHLFPSPFFRYRKKVDA